MAQLGIGAPCATYIGKAGGQRSALLAVVLLLSAVLQKVMVIQRCFGPYIEETHKMVFAAQNVSLCLLYSDSCRAALPASALGSITPVSH